MKSIKRYLLYLLILVFLLIGYLSFGNTEPASEIAWGLSFSQKQAESLGLDPREVYLAVLDELGVTHMRLSSYWDEVEAERGIYDFSGLDFMIEQAATRNRKIILVLGRRQPRWPECHIPQWASTLPNPEQDEAVLAHLQRVVERYRENQAITAWQVENEFYLRGFGECPDYTADFLQREIELVRGLDSRPIIITDSGELSAWTRSAPKADIFASTMYRKVISPIGPFTYPHPPVYYSRLGSLVGLISSFDRQIITELQMEPWAETVLSNDSQESYDKTFAPEDFAKNLKYAENSGLDEFYLWGAEWWYYMKTMRGNDFYWEEGKKIWEDEN